MRIDDRMIINAYQLEIMKGFVYDEFIQRMTKRARGVHKEITKDLSDAQMEVLVRYYSDTAVNNNIGNELYIEQFIDLCFENPELNLQPMPKWITDILSFPDMPEDLKIKKLSMYLEFGTVDNDEDSGLPEDEFFNNSTIV